MAPFRIAVRHPDKGHHDHGWAHVQGLFDERDEADERLEEAEGALGDGHAEQFLDVRTAASLPPEERVRKRDHVALAELLGLGYEYKLQELVPAEFGKDDAGQEVVIRHRWKDVK